jgi:RNA polymerase sigma-70 factor (ECF subfamily)
MRHVTAHQSFLEHVMPHQSDLRAFIGSLVTDQARREDIFQETALTLWQKFEHFDHSRSFGAWARGVAANKILQAKRQDHRFPMPFDPEVIAQVA